MRAATVSVVIPTYNYGRFVRDAVDSALAQTYRDCEIIVVDDGSTDDTRALLAPYGDRIRYLYQDNRGLSAARNAGIRAVRGAYVAFLDSDDIWMPAKIEAQMALFAANPDLGLVSCGGFTMDVDGDVSDTRFVRPAENDRNRGRVYRKLILGNFISGGSNAVVRRACLDAVGLFDERLRSAEDWDLWLRVARDYEIAFVHEPLVKVRLSPGSMSGASNVDRMLANERLVLDRYCADDRYPVGRLLAGRAYAERFGRAALAYLSIGDRRNAWRHLATALRWHPVHVCTQRPLMTLAFRLAAGEQMFARLRGSASTRQGG